METTAKSIEKYESEDRKRLLRGPLRITSQIIEASMNDLKYEDDIDRLSELTQEIYEIVGALLSQETLLGDADDFHNFAVNLARNDLYDLACDVLEAGLARFPRNIDLLADYLQYGSSCGRKERCSELYEILIKIPKVKWTWRGYSFSLNHLQQLWEDAESEEELESIKAKMFEILESYHKYLGDEEDCYKCEADVYKLLHESEKEEEILQEALTTLKKTPKCALRLADFFFERGKYEHALACVQRGLEDSDDTQSSVSIPYLYFLRGLSKKAIYGKSSGDWTKEEKEEYVLSIYSDFNLAAKQEKRKSYRSSMRTAAISLESESGIEITSEYNELLELIEEYM